MNDAEKKQIVLATLEQVNLSWSFGRANSLTTTRAGEVAPDAAYIELVRELLALVK